MRRLIAALVLVVLGLTAGCGSDSDGPGPTAKQWAEKTIEHDDGAASLQCRPELHTELDTLAMATSTISGFDVVRTSKRAEGSWTVTLATRPDKTTFGVHVVRHDGHYAVCD